MITSRIFRACTTLFACFAVFAMIGPNAGAAPTGPSDATSATGPAGLTFYNFTLPVMTKLGFGKEQIYTSLENRMKCGIGKCGRCNVGHKYVCLDGPVFSMAELAKLPPEY